MGEYDLAGFLKKFLPIILFLLCHSAFSQNKDLPKGKGTIIGTISDSVSGEKIGYATLTLMKDSGLQVVNGSLSNSKGVFKIGGLANGAYRLKVESIGYRMNLTASILISDQTPSINLGNILIGKASTVLAEVTVTAKTPLVENKIDRIVYNVEKDITSQGGVATDVLRKVPEVAIDVDGNVELQGSGNIRFLINGKPSTMFGNSIADALQAIPASQIKSIEVITSPGAKYDAEGTGGIINIILKSNKMQGVNGTLNMSAGTRLENGSFNLNARKGSFGAHAFFSGNAKLPSTTLTGMNRNSIDTIDKTTDQLLQNGTSSLLRNGFQSSAGFDWTLNKKNNLSGSFEFNNFNFHIHGYSDQQQITTPDSPAGVSIPPFNSVLYPDNQFHFQETGYQLDYKKTFDQEDKELDISFQYNDGRDRSTINQYQELPGSDSIFAGTRSLNPGREQETVANLDYNTLLTGKTKIETGAKATFDRIDGNTTALDLYPQSGAYLYDSSLSNSLKYTRQVYAGYLSLSFPLYKIADIKIGARYERTENSALFSGQPLLNLPGYNTLAPAVYISRKLDDKNTLKLTYTKRIQRPEYRELNPFINTSDPKNLSAGNPTLQPEIGHRIEIGYSRSFENDGSFTVSLFLRANEQDIQPYVVYYPSLQVGDSTYYNTSFSKPQNIGLEDMTGLSLFGSVPFTKKLTVRGNLSIFNKYIHNRFVPGSTADSYNYRVNINATYQFNKSFFAEFFGNFNSARNEVQGKYPSFTTYSLAFKKQIFHQKGSLGFTTTNPFNEYVVQNTQLNGQEFVVNSYRKIAYRSFGISFSYKFGKLEFKKEKERENQDNAQPSLEN